MIKQKKQIQGRAAAGGVGSRGLPLHGPGKLHHGRDHLCRWRLHEERLLLNGIELKKFEKIDQHGFETTLDLLASAFLNPSVSHGSACLKPTFVRCWLAKLPELGC